MNDQSKLMNPPPPPQMIGQPPPQQRMNPPPSQVMNPVQPRIMNQTPLLGQSHPIMGMNQQPQVMMNNQPMMMNPRNFNLNPSMSSEYQNPPPNNFGSKHSKMIRNNWKGKKITGDKRPMMEQPIRRMHNSGIPMYNPQQLPGSGSIQVGPVGAGGYKPPTLNELQSQNRLKTRKFYPKKKYANRYVPYAPRNTTSFIIRAKKSGGIAELNQINEFAVQTTKRGSFNKQTKYQRLLPFFATERDLTQSCSQFAETFLYPKKQQMKK